MVITESLTPILLPLHFLWAAGASTQESSQMSRGLRPVTRTPPRKTERPLGLKCTKYSLHLTQSSLLLPLITSISKVTKDTLFKPDSLWGSGCL